MLVTLWGLRVNRDDLSIEVKITRINGKFQDFDN